MVEDQDEVKRQHYRGGEPSERDQRMLEAVETLGRPIEGVAAEFFPNMKEPGRTKYMQRILRLTKSRMGRWDVALEVKAGDEDILMVALQDMEQKLGDMQPAFRRWTPQRVAELRNRILIDIREQTR